MEVHAHSHTAADPDPSTSAGHRGRKKWTHYFWEFFDAIPRCVLRAFGSVSARYIKLKETGISSLFILSIPK